MAGVIQIYLNEKGKRKRKRKKVGWTGTVGSNFYRRTSNGFAYELMIALISRDEKLET